MLSGGRPIATRRQIIQVSRGQIVSHRNVLTGAIRENSKVERIHRDFSGLCQGRAGHVWRVGAYELITAGLARQPRGCRTLLASYRAGPSGIRVGVRGCNKKPP